MRVGDTIPRRGHVVGEMARTRRVKKVFSDGWLASYARSLERRDAPPHTNSTSGRGMNGDGRSR